MRAVLVIDMQEGMADRIRAGRPTATPDAPDRIAALLAQARARGGEGREWERTTDIAYVVQGGPLKDLAVRWRNATARSNYAEGADENRVIVSYSIGF